MVASWRVATATSVSLTRLVNPGMLISLWTFILDFGVTASGRYPISRSLPTTSARLSPSKLTLHQLAGAVADLVIERQCHDRLLRIQVVAEVFLVATPVEGDGFGDPTLSHQLRQTLVHRLHAVLTTDLHQ